MAEHSTIEWTRGDDGSPGSTWNIVTGCSVVSPGCAHCYAMRWAGGRLKHHPSRRGLTIPSKAGPVWTGEVRFNREWLTLPLGWKRPRRIFVAAHGDLFHEAVPDSVLDQVFAVIALAPRHSFQVLTKRAERMRAYLSAPSARDRIETLAFDWLQTNAGRDAAEAWYDGGNGPRWPLPTVWLGVSAEDQQRAEERIPHLLATPAAVRFLSAEPLLGPINLRNLAVRRTNEGSPAPPTYEKWHALGGGRMTSDHKGPWLGRHPCPQLDWVIAGGESGLGARPMHPDWARSLRDQCTTAGVAFFFKQWGEWTPGENVERQRGIVDGAHWFADKWSFSRENLADTDGHIDDQPDLYRVGKKTAGRLLDGRTWDQMPEARRG